MSDLRTMWVGMRAEDAVALFERLAEDARQAIGRDGAMKIELLAEPNEVSGEVRLVFNNDDMERPEMAGRTIVEWESA
jgi:hypothetical protein